MIEDDEIQGVLPSFQKVEAKKFVKVPRPLPTEAHVLAKDISEYCGEVHQFAKYLGVITRKGLPWAYKTFSEMKSFQRELMKKGDYIKNPAALFMSKSAST